MTRSQAECAMFMCVQNRKKDSKNLISENLPSKVLAIRQVHLSADFHWSVLADDLKGVQLICRN